ncbi:MAG: HugZ family protein [Burkholderiales bacterium]
MNIPIEEIIHLLHKASYGVLATQSTQVPGYPFASILPFVLDEQQRPVFLISGLAEHTKNVLADHRTSFLVASPGGHNILTDARVTLVGDMQHCEATEELVARYLRYQPDASQFLKLRDFAFFRLTPKSARYVAGFGRMGWVEESVWVQAATLPLADEEKLFQELLEVLPMGIRLLGLDCYGADLDRHGERERQVFHDAPIDTKNAVEAMKRLLVAM